MPQSLSKYVYHARCFSMLVQGATLQYFHLLLGERDKRGIAKAPYDLSDVFNAWWKATLKDLSNWRVEEFLCLAKGMNALRRVNDALFIKTWLRLNTTANSARSFLNSREADELIRQRERITRPTKSRLYHLEYLQRWKPPDSIESIADDPHDVRFRLDYRAKWGRTFVQDILTAGGRNNV
jgi:hypothetical protein